MELGSFILDGKEDPRGIDVLTSFDKEDLEDEVKKIKRLDTPHITPEDFWEAYDLCRVDPYRLIWEIYDPEDAIFVFEHYS